MRKVRRRCNVFITKIVIFFEQSFLAQPSNIHWVRAKEISVPSQSFSLGIFNPSTEDIYAASIQASEFFPLNDLEMNVYERLGNKLFATSEVTRCRDATFYGVQLGTRRTRLYY